MIRGVTGQIQMEIVDDPEELARFHADREQLEKNLAWFRAHSSEIYRKHRAKCICVAGQELFVADTSPEAVAMATQAHPEDHGWFIRYIPRENIARIYAYRRRMAAV
jgi:hypothetical protein